MVQEVDRYGTARPEASSRPVRTCTCRMSIQGVPAVVLIDTGSMVTIVKSSLVQNRLLPSSEENVEVVLKSASGHTIPITREATLRFEVGRELREHKAFLCPDLLHDAIIGFDFLQRHNIVIDAANQALWLNPAERIKLEQEKTRPSDTSMGLYLARPEVSSDHDRIQDTDSQETAEDDEARERGREETLQREAEGRDEQSSTTGQTEDDDQPRESESKTTGSDERKGKEQKRPEDLDTGTLNPEDREALLDLIKKHSVCFSWNGELGTCELIEHRIPLTSNKPIRRPAYQVAHTQREFIESEVREMLKKGVIEPSVSPYAAGVVLVPKKTGELRFCVDYRGLNQVTISDHYPLPVAHTEIFDTLGEATIFSCLDCQQGYWQVKVAPEDRPKTAFRCFLGLYQFRRTPFGLKGAPATYQRLMSHILSGYIGRFCHCFIDDVICYSKTFTEHLEHLRLIFERLQEAGIKLKPTKCVFAKERVNYLGHVISVGELRPDPGNVAKIRDLPPPQTRREVRSFIGMATYYRCFVPDFSRRAKPLTDLTKTRVALHWGPEQDSAFTDLKNALTSEPVLALPDFTRPFILMTDGSSTGLGAVLGQQFDDDAKERVIGFASRKTTEGEGKFSACELECLALVWAVKHFRTYILGRKTTVVTDHWALKWLLDLKNGNPRLQRWRMALQEYDLEVVHKPGRLHRNADFLSRIYEDQKVTGLPETQHSHERAGETEGQNEEETGSALPESHHGDKLVKAETNPANSEMEARHVQVVRFGKETTGKKSRSPDEHPKEAPTPGYTREDHTATILRNQDRHQNPLKIPEEAKGEPDTVTERNDMPSMEAVLTRRKAKEIREQQHPNEEKRETAEEAGETQQNYHPEPKTPSRTPPDDTPAQPTRPTNQNIPTQREDPTTGREQLKLEQQDDSDCRDIEQSRIQGAPLPKWAQGSEFRTAQDGVLEKVDRDVIGTEVYKPVLPASMMKTAVQDAHAGHLKTAKTLAKLREKFFFRNMHAQCSKYIEGCNICQEKDRGRKLKAPLGTLPRSWGAWHTVAVDVRPKPRLARDRRCTPPSNQGREQIRPSHHGLPLQVRHRPGHQGPDGRNNSSGDDEQIPGVWLPSTPDH